MTDSIGDTQHRIAENGTTISEAKAENDTVTNEIREDRDTPHKSTQNMAFPYSISAEIVTDLTVNTYRNVLHMTKNATIVTDMEVTKQDRSHASFHEHV